MASATCLCGHNPDYCLEPGETTVILRLKDEIADQQINQAIKNSLEARVWRVLEVVPETYGLTNSGLRRPPRVGFVLQAIMTPEEMAHTPFPNRVLRRRK